MKKSKCKSSKKQAELRLLAPADAHAVIREALRQELHRTTLRMVQQLFQDEITALCGPRQARDRDAEAVRGGSEKGSIRWDGKRRPVRRPRARDEDGGQSESDGAAHAHIVAPQAHNRKWIATWFA